jgi:HEAT repeat protein
VGLIVLGALASGAAAATLAARATQPVTVGGVMQGPLGPDSAQVGAFLAALRATSPVVCELVSDQIGNFWTSDGGIGVGRYADSRTSVREEKQAVSSRVRDAGAIRYLASQLGDTDPCIRMLAAKMLGNSTATDAMLERLLESPSPKVREAALRAVSERDRPALRGRVERLLDEGDASVSAMAAFALGELEQRSSIGPLRRALRRDAPMVRAASAWALGQIEDPTVAPELDALLGRETDRRVRLAAIEALGNLDGLSVAPASLVRAASDSDRGVQLAALEALADFEDEVLAPVFLPHITDEDPHVRMLVIEALGEMRSRSAVPAITRALRDPDPDVRRAAIEALAEIDDQ